ncbi:ESPR domain-containing protein, partial [Oxalobacter sp. JAC-2022]|uniref:ESPR domain-containing protein n=1 Tax=Oxalobacter aliiformigenes TaxID=2946593 RepID=UPI0022B04031
MNRIFRVIFSKASGAWIAASELAKTKGKKSTRTVAATVMAGLFVPCLFPAVQAADFESSQVSTQAGADALVGNLKSGDNKVEFTGQNGIVLGDTSAVENLNFDVSGTDEAISAVFHGSGTEGNLVFSGSDKTISFSGFQTLVFDADGKTALSSGGGGKIDIDAEDITVKSEKANSILEGGTISMEAGHVSLNQTSVNGTLNIQAGSLDTQGQLWVSPSGKVSLGTDTSPLGEATIDYLNTWGQVDLYARELTFEKRVSASRGEDLSPEQAAKVTIHAVPEQKTTFVAGAITSNNASLTVESGKVVSDGVIQANSASRISLGSDSTPLESLTVTGQSETSANALLRSYEASIDVKARQVSISQPRGKEQYALSAFGGGLTIESDDIKIDGKISAGVIEDCFNGRTDNSNYRQDAFDSSSLVIRSLSENGITQITGDILTYNDSEEQQNNVQISLSGEKSYLDGSIQNLNSKEKAISATKNGTTLNLSEGATWNVKGASAVQAINTKNGATINTETHQTDITDLTNNGTLDLNTSTGRAGQIAIGEL